MAKANGKRLFLAYSNLSHGRGVEGNIGIHCISLIHMPRLPVQDAHSVCMWNILCICGTIQHNPPSVIGVPGYHPDRKRCRHEQTIYTAARSLRTLHKVGVHIPASVASRGSG